MAGLYHLDCPSGIAGDMFLGACLDVGLPLEVLSATVEAIGLAGVTVEGRSARRGGLRGIRFRVLIDGVPVEGPDPEEGASSSGVSDGSVTSGRPRPAPRPVHRDLASIRRLIGDSGLAAPVRDRATSLFVRLAEVEAAVHGVEVDRVHFHEVGATDSIVDLVGAAAAVEELAPDRLTCSTVVVGGGTVRTEHGVMPVPTPATAELLAGLPVRGSAEGELVTPTGALILSQLVDAFGPLPPMRIVGSGYGLGRRELRSGANACRLLRGEATGDGGSPDVMVVQCEVDDLAGEGFGFLLERLLEEGALDVFFTPVQMKKSRPGVLVTLLCRALDLERLAGLLLSESGSLGCRYHPASRFEAEREERAVSTPYGEVRVKRAVFAGRTVAEAPEYEDCRRLARRHGVPFREVYRGAVVALAKGGRGGDDAE